MTQEHLTNHEEIEHLAHHPPKPPYVPIGSQAPYKSAVSKAGTAYLTRCGSPNGKTTWFWYAGGARDTWKRVSHTIWEPISIQIVRLGLRASPICTELNPQDEKQHCFSKLMLGMALDTLWHDSE